MRYTNLISSLAVSLAFSAAAATVSVSLPQNWHEGESIDLIDGYVRISAPRLSTPSCPVAAPALPVYVFDVEIPRSATVTDISADVEWSDPVSLSAQVLPIPAAVKYPDPVVIPAPDSELYSLDCYPASPVADGGTFLMRGKRRLAVRFTPYRYNPVAGTIRRATSATVVVAYEEGRETQVARRASLLSAAVSGDNPQFVIISPPAFTNLWKAYVDYRAVTHPDLTMAIANTDDIYDAFSEAVASNDYALAIHNYLESLYDEGNGALETVILGAGAPGRTSTGAYSNWHSFTNGFLAFDPQTQIPARYAIVENKSAHEATDMYYACMDKTDSTAAEVWDYDGDGIYMATLQSDGTMVNEDSANIDWAADLEVMRVPLQPLIVETSAGNRLSGDVVATVTAEQQMANFIAKIKYLESSEWKGAGRSAVLGESEIYGFGNNNKSRGNTSTEYLHEHEFFDGALDPWNTEREETIQSNETAMRYRAWQFAAGVRANGRIWHCVGEDDALPDVYGSENDGYVSRTTHAEALAAIQSVDHDAFNVFSHGWARGAAPLSSLDLMRGYYEGVARVYFAGKPCDSGMYDYSLGGQTITNRICLGGAAVLAPGGAAVSFNNTRYGVWYGLDYRTSSQLEGLVMSAAYNGNCTNTAFDVDNPAVNSPITLGKALLLARQRAVVTDSNRFAKFNDDGSCLVEVTGFGDPLMTLSAQPDAADDFSTECVRKLSLTADADISSTNSAAVLAVGDGVSAISGDGILRATVATEIAGDSLEWSVAGGMGRSVAFANAGGKLTFPGKKKRYVGPSFEKVGEVAVTGSGVTVDFGLASDNYSCPVGKLSFCSSSFGTNTLRNANANMSSDFYSATIGVANSVLLAETSSPFPAAITNAELRVVTNPLWTGLDWNKTVELNNGLFSIAQDGFALADGATFNVVGDGGESICGGSVVDETDTGVIYSSGAINVNLSNDGWFVFESPLQASDADGSLTVRGKGVLYLPNLPLVGYTNLVIGSTTTLVLPGNSSSAVLLISGGTTSSVTFEGTPNVYRIEDESELSISNWGVAMNNPVVRGGTIVPDGASSVVDPPYARTLSSASESWFNSTAWTGNGSPFTDTWANSEVYSGQVDLYVADGADEIELTVEDSVTATTLYVADASGATAPGDLTITATNGLTAGLIVATNYSGTLSLDFDLGSAALVPNADTHVLGTNGTGKLTIPAGSRATLYTGEWLGAVANSGVLKRADTLSMASSELVAGTNSFINGTITTEDTDTSHHFLVEDGDTLTIYGRKRAQGFNVTGGDLTFSQTSQGVWFGGGGKPYIQTGGSVTINCAAASSSSPYNADTACNLQWTGTTAYSMIVSGGTFDVPNGYLLIWNNNAAFTVTGDGVVSAKGVSCHTASPENRKLFIMDGGTFELGEFGFAAQSPATTVSGGVLAAMADASIDASITLANATLAAAEGVTLTVAKQFASATGTLTIGTTNYTGTVDFGTNRVAGVTLGTNSCGRAAFTLTAAEAAAGTVTLFSADEIPSALTMLFTNPDGTAAIGTTAISNGKVVFTRTQSVTLPLTAAVDGTQNWSELTWVDADNIVVSSSKLILPSLDEVHLTVAGETNAVLTLNETTTLPSSFVVDGPGKLHIDTGIVSDEELPSLVIEGATVETDNVRHFTDITNNGVFRLNSDTNLVISTATMLPGTNSYARAIGVGEFLDTTRVLLVEEGDEIAFRADHLTPAANRHTEGIVVTGGKLSFTNLTHDVRFGSNASSAPSYLQTGGEVVCVVRSASASDTTAYYGVLLGQTGSGGTYSFDVLGGTFTVADAHLNFWNSGETMRIASGGVVSVKGVMSHSDSSSNTLTVETDGVLELGETGICAKAPRVTLAGGTIRAIADATISPSITYTRGILAAASRKTLTVAGGFSSTPSTITIGAEGWDGTVNFGTTRLTGVTLDSASVGKLGFTITEDEFTAGTASLIACDGSLPDGVTLALVNDEGTEVEYTASVVDGVVVVAVTRPPDSAPTLVRPSAVWNCDFVDGETRGGFTLSLGGNVTESSGAVVISSGNNGVSVTNASGFANTESRFIAVAAISNVTDNADGGVFFTVQSANNANRVGAYNSTYSILGYNSGSSYTLTVTPSGGYYSDDGALHWLGAYYSTDRVTNYGTLGGKGTFAYVDINSDGAVSAGKDGLVYSNDSKNYGITFGGLYGASTKQLAGARIRYIAMFTNVQAVATNVISQWTLDAMTAAESPADGGTITGGANVGVNLSGGSVNVSGSATAAALFVQEDTTLVFADGATLAVSGPVYVADGATLYLSTSTALDFKTPSRTLLTLGSVAYEDGQIATAMSEDYAAYSVSLYGSSLILTRTATEDIYVYPTSFPTTHPDFTDAAWTGLVVLTNINVNKTLPIESYGNSNSTLRLVKMSGYTGTSSSRSVTVDSTVELVDSEDGTAALTIMNGFSDGCCTMRKIVGDGTFKTTANPNGNAVYQGFVVNDASGFTGDISIYGSMFTFGETVRKNDTTQKGTMFIDAGYSVTNAVGATWSVSNLVVMGELVVRGELSVPNSVVFSNGASFVVGTLPEGGVVLTSASITTNGAFSVSVMGDSTEYAVSVIENADGTKSLVLSAGAPTEVTVPVTVQRYIEGEWGETTLECVLPAEWLTNYYPAVSSSAEMVSQYKAASANGAAVWQCYMLGLDPTNAESTVSLSLDVVDGQIRFDVCGLGDTHAVDGITAYWYLMTSTDLVADPSFSNERECVQGLVPAFTAHSMPDKATADSEGTESRLFYKITVSFVAE